MPNNLRFPGQYYDAESGKHYNYHRDYDSGLGRYLQSDPIKLSGGLNTFLYPTNPIMNMDVFGLSTFIKTHINSRVVSTCKPNNAMKKCLPEVMGFPETVFDNFEVIEDSDFLKAKRNDDAAVTEPGAIRLKSCVDFWKSHKKVLHEYYHAIYQWGQGEPPPV